MKGGKEKNKKKLDVHFSSNKSSLSTKSQKVDEIFDKIK